MSGPFDRSAWDRLDSTLMVLRGCGPAAELVECACELALRGCGADAAAIGRVRDGVWTPWLRAGRPELLESLGSDGTLPSEPVSLAGTRPSEEEVLESGRAVLRPLSRERIECGERAIPGASQVAVAPITTRGSVLGLLHVVGVDLHAEIVDSYARALGSMFGLTGVRRRAEEQRYTLARLRHGVADGAEPAVELYETAPDPRPARLVAAPARSRSSALRARLTARQREILDLMASGLSNAEMAEHLVVALPTVKSHVRAVLRASGAVNRSDALARFARGEGP